MSELERRDDKWGCATLALCVLLAGCSKPAPLNSMADAVVLCNGFGGAKEIGWYRATTTLYKREVTVEARCNDGSSVWRSTEEKL